MTFQRIYDAIVEVAPQLAPKNTFIIHEWLTSGYDTEKDILPAIAEQAKRGLRSVYSFAWFTNGIKQKHGERLKAEAINKNCRVVGIPLYKPTPKEQLPSKEVREYVKLGLSQLASYLKELDDPFMRISKERLRELQADLWKPRLGWRSYLNGRPLIEDSQTIPTLSEQLG